LRKAQTKAGYEQVVTPHIGQKELYVTSGHYEKYGADSFLFFDVKFSLFKKKIGETVYEVVFLLGGSRLAVQSLVLDLVLVAECYTYHLLV
jgi:seryl-tRNA synthetase